MMGRINQKFPTMAQPKMCEVHGQKWCKSQRKMMMRNRGWLWGEMTFPPILWGNVSPKKHFLGTSLDFFFLIPSNSHSTVILRSDFHQQYLDQPMFFRFSKIWEVRVSRKIKLKFGLMRTFLVSSKRPRGIKKAETCPLISCGRMFNGCQNLVFGEQKSFGEHR